MMSAENCVKAAELLAEREDLAEPIARMRAATSIRIEYSSAPNNWFTGPSMPVNKALRALMLEGVLAQLAAIDAKLAALGVAPPSNTGAA